MEAKFYDSRGIIPKVDENLESYLNRSLNDLDSLKLLHDDIKEKKIKNISTIKIKLEGILKSGEYEVLDNGSMRQYGFQELFFPNVVLANEVYNPLFIDPKERVGLQSAAVNIPVLYNGNNLSLTFINQNTLELDSSQYEDCMDNSLIMRLFKFQLENDVIEHETVHGVRRLANLQKTIHFEELIANSNSLYKRQTWKEYFSESIKQRGISLSHPFSSIINLMEYSYLKNNAKKGVFEKIPLPLLVRINIKEFIDIAKQMGSGKEIETIVNEKSESQLNDSWRWQLIAEHCGY